MNKPVPDFTNKQTEWLSAEDSIMNDSNKIDNSLSENHYHSNKNVVSEQFTDFQVSDNSTQITIGELKEQLACIPPGEALIVNMAGFDRDSVNEVVNHAIWYGLRISYKLPYLSFERESEIGGGN